MKFLPYLILGLASPDCALDLKGPVSELLLPNLIQVTIMGTYSKSSGVLTTII